MKPCTDGDGSKKGQNSLRVMWKTDCVDREHASDGGAALWKFLCVENLDDFPLRQFALSAT
jgi:hypothetical protein